MKKTIHTSALLAAMFFSPLLSLLTSPFGEGLGVRWGEAFSQPGSLDNTFGTGGKVTTGINNYDWGASMAIQSDGKILVAGETADNISYSWAFALVRYNSNGTLDATFGNGGIDTMSIGNSDDIINSVVLQSDGKILVAGESFHSIGNVYLDWDFALVRLNSDGSLDNTFGIGGIDTTDFGNYDDFGKSAAIQTDGKIIVAGYRGHSNSQTEWDFALARYNSNGGLDNAFGSGGKVITDFGNSYDYGYSVAIQSDGKIVLAGYSNNNGSNNDLALARYNSDGSLDNTFGSGGKVTTAIGNGWDSGNSVSIQSDGKILVAGTSDNGSYGYDFVLVRYNSDGSLDSTFDTDGKVTTDFVSPNDNGNSAAIQTDGKILVAGQSGNSNDYDFTLARYLSDGSLDNTFDTDGKVTTSFGSYADIGYSVAIQNDGKIVVAGTKIDIPSSFNYDIAVARYNGDAQAVGITENTEESTVSVYPNPTTGKFTFVITSPDVIGTKQSQIEIYNLLGEKVLALALTFISNVREAGAEADISSIPNGIYFLELKDEERKMYKMIIKE